MSSSTQDQIKSKKMGKIKEMKMFGAVLRMFAEMVN